MFFPALACASLALLLCLGPLEGIPHVTDEVAYGVQAGNFQHLRLWGAAPASPSMALYPFIATELGFHGVFPPGWPLLLALGSALGLPWLVNPLLAALIPLLTFRLAQQTVGARVAWLAAWSAALSPGVLVLAASRMSQTSVLVALLGLAVVVTAPRHGARSGLLAGLCLAYVVLARPYDGVLVGGPLLLALLPRRRSVRVLVPLLVLPLLAAVAVLAYNHALTGNATTFPASQWFDGFFPERPGCNRLGFGVGVGCAEILPGSPGYTPAKGLVNLLHNLLTFDRLLLGVPGGGLAALAGLVLLRRRLFFGLLVVIPLGYLFYWSPGAAYGARFYHPLFLVAPIGLAVLLSRVRSRLAWLPLLLPVVGLSLAARELADSYWCVDGSLRRLLAQHRVTEGVIFLESRGQRVAAWPYLGVPEFVCDPLLASGEGFAVYGFEGEGGLHVRHMPADLEQARAYLEQIHPGEAAWLVQTHLKAAERRLWRLDGDEPLLLAP